MNHIITHYTGNLDQPGIRSFVHSLENVDANVIFFTSNLEVPSFLQTDRIRVVVTPDRGMSIPNFQRHFDILDLLEAEKPQGKFLVCDCRDLVFLGDPFAPLLIHTSIEQLRALVGDPFAPLQPVSDRLHVFQECALYRNRDEYYNRAWLEAMHTTALERLGDFVTLCGGTIMSESLNSMLDYHRTHVEVVNRYLPTADLNRFNDQSTFNDTIRSCLPNSEIAVHSNEAPSVVYTLGNVPPDEYTIVNDRIWVNDFCPSVIHQYDRRDRAYQLVRKLFPCWPGWLSP